MGGLLRATHALLFKGPEMGIVCPEDWDYGLDFGIDALDTILEDGLEEEEEEVVRTRKPLTRILLPYPGQMGLIKRYIKEEAKLRQLFHEGRVKSAVQRFLKLRTKYGTSVPGEIAKLRRGFSARRRLVNRATNIVPGNHHQGRCWPPPCMALGGVDLPSIVLHSTTVDLIPATPKHVVVVVVP